MGQTLSEPITEKTSSCCRDWNYLVGSSCMQGWRIKMEDSHVHILSLPDDPGTSFFAVYDGHGGATMSQYAGKHLHEYIIKTKEYREGNIVRAMEQGFLQLDKVMQDDVALKTERSGTTVIAVLIKNNILYCANAGDSRAVACINGKTLSLSRDHKPTLVDESRRIQAAGGWVEFNRVNGHLALSRALGDFKFKRNNNKSAEDQVVTAFPEVKTFHMNEDWEFIILACDGIWDVLLSIEVVDFVRKKLANLKNDNDDCDAEDEPINPEVICEDLLDHCLAPDALMGTGCDNMTVILVCLLHGKPQSDLIIRCQRQFQSPISDLCEPLSEPVWELHGQTFAFDTHTVEDKKRTPHIPKSAGEKEEEKEQQQQQQRVGEEKDEKKEGEQVVEFHEDGEKKNSNKDKEQPT